MTASSSSISIKSFGPEIEKTSLTLAQIQAQLRRSREALEHKDGLHSPDARLQEGALYHLHQVLKYDIRERCNELLEGAPFGIIPLADDHMRMLYEAYREAVSIWKDALTHELGRVEDEIAEVDSMLMTDLNDDAGSTISDRGTVDDDPASGTNRDEGSEWC
ncbi:hypothetical protein HII31_07834 [Pseudocercospora fuligena]|uniref:Uncharacterized protein n=1 Tax=Pseudocercospora fuligena TaxID=685502 RepID=A0A8H6VGK3_9PEZI|nr:hypothetical protein HII31_07834 [Pseudocercospora fuligena]